MKNIILTGMPGSGKTTFGKALARSLGRVFYDADEVLESRENRSIKDFFAESEAAFRSAETRTLSYLASMQGAVIATGGGAVKKAENMQLLKKNGTVIFIDRLPENIVGCITDDSRPLLAADKQRIFNLYQERIALYRQHADRIVANNGDSGETLAALLTAAKEIIESEKNTCS